MPKNKDGKTYTCDECGEMFELEDDEVANQEAIAKFGKGGEDPGMAIVCDDCYKRFMERFN